MTRKFIQMGMTRAKRYANHKGGRKYDADGKEIAKAEHKGKAEKEEASRIFKEVWERCKAYEGYIEKKKRFVEEQKAWDREQTHKEPGIETDCTTRIPTRRKRKTIGTD